MWCWFPTFDIGAEKSLRKKHCRMIMQHFWELDYGGKLMLELLIHYWRGSLLPVGLINSYCRYDGSSIAFTFQENVLKFLKFNINKTGKRTILKPWKLHYFYCKVWFFKIRFPLYLCDGAFENRTHFLLHPK